jgi:menaquinone-dependent protoporphyrinogen IX oxidase
MRAAVVFFSAMSRDRILSIARSLARGIESQGHQVDIVDGTRDVNTKLTIYQYIAVGTEPFSNFGGKIPDKVGQFLNSSGMVAGKRSFAFVTKNLAGSPKALSRLMKSMEKEGMFLKYSAILSNAQEAEEIGKRLHVVR